MRIDRGGGGGQWDTLRPCVVICLPEKRTDALFLFSRGVFSTVDPSKLTEDVRGREGEGRQNEFCRGGRRRDIWGEFSFCCLFFFAVFLRAHYTREVVVRCQKTNRAPNASIKQRVKFRTKTLI